MRIATIGDLVVDVVVRLSDALVIGDDRAAAITVGPGGQAANVACWAATLGAQARYIGRCGEDIAGDIVAARLRTLGVEVCGPRGGRTGTVVSIAAIGDRTMASDRGSATQLEPSDLDQRWFDCDAFHVSGYALAVEPLAFAAVEGAKLARAAGATVSFDVSATTILTDAFRSRVHSLRPDIAFATEREKSAFGHLDTRWVIKRGPLGASVDGVEYAAEPITVVDTTGAGDAFAAGFLIGGPNLAIHAAARCCSHAGAVP